MDTTRESMPDLTRPVRPFPEIMKYRDVRVDPLCRLTSANPGDACTSASVGMVKRIIAQLPPNYVHEHISRKIAKELRCTIGQAEQLLKDVSNFLWLAAQSPDTTVPSPIIDEAWHIFVLFTSEYIIFCNDYCGGYVHHAPHTGSEIQMSTEYVRPTVDLVHRLFGEKPSTNWDYISQLQWQAEHAIAA